jgi:hypothetical protein
VQKKTFQSGPRLSLDVGSEHTVSATDCGTRKVWQEARQARQEKRRCRSQKLHMFLGFKRP